MSAPKSVVKVNRNGIEYTSNVEACEYYLYELSRAALRDVGKFVRKQFGYNYYSVFKKHSGDGGRAVNYKVISGKYTEYPRVQIGLKAGRVDGFYAYFQEFGTRKQQKYGILSKTVEENIATIVEIESKYLSGLEDEARALAMIDEGDYEDED